MREESKKKTIQIGRLQHQSAAAKTEPEPPLGNILRSPEDPDERHPELTLATEEVGTWIKLPLKYVLSEPEVRIVGTMSLNRR